MAELMFIHRQLVTWFGCYSKLDYYSLKKDEYSKRLGRKFIKRRPLNTDIAIFSINKPTTTH